MKPDQRLRLIRSYVSEQFVALGIVADLAIHDDGTNHNPHAHVMLPMRQVNAWGFKPVKTREWNSRNMLNHWREQWAEYANNALKDAGFRKRVDHRTLKAQGIDRKPTIHEGPKARELAAKNHGPTPSSTMHHRGWRGLSWSRDYRLTDFGMSRVAYNRYIQLENKRRMLMKAPSVAAYSAFGKPPLQTLSAEIYLTKRKLWTAQLRAARAVDWHSKLRVQKRQFFRWRMPMTLLQWFAYQRYDKRHKTLIKEAESSIRSLGVDVVAAQKRLRVLDSDKQAYEQLLRAHKVKRQMAASLSVVGKTEHSLPHILTGQSFGRMPPYP